MKVFHLIDSGGYFGAERVLLTLAQQQKLQGYDVSIVSYGARHQANKAVETECERAGLTLLKWRGGAFRNLVGLIAKNKNSIFHSHGYKFNILLAVLAVMNRKLIAVATVHGYTNAPRYSKLWLYYFLNKIALKTLKGSVFVSAQAALASNINLGKKNIVIHNGISVNPPSVTGDNNTFYEGDYIVAAGRFSAEKAFGDLIVAFNRISDSYKELFLVLIGDGPERNALSAMAMGSNKIIFMGHLDNPIPIIEKSRLVVISSLSEGLPIVLLEAMRAGRDIVSTAVGAIPSVIDDGVSGVLCKPGDDVALYGAIKKALMQEQGYFGVAARNRFSENFTAEKMFLKYHEWYQKLVEI